MSRKFLILDTSGDDSFIALHHSNTHMDVTHLSASKQSQELQPALEKIVGNEPIDFIAIGVGPGSFTGTRVGVMTAKALSFSRNIPLVTFCSLKRYVPEWDGPFTIATSAKSQGFYTLKGEKKGDSVKFSPPTLDKSDPPHATLALNLPFLASYTQKKFENRETLPHHKVNVHYLHTP